MDTERPISFIGTTGANSKTQKEHEFDESGVITGADVSTHQGQEYTLRYYAQLIREGSKVTLWNPLDEVYLAGDGEDYNLSFRFEFDSGDVLQLRAVNTSDYEYHHNMSVSIDYDEKAGKFGSLIGGVF
jgi:hypothetical protein